MLFQDVYQMQKICIVIIMKQKKSLFIKKKRQFIKIIYWASSLQLWPRCDS